MTEIRFSAIVGEDGVIRPPAGVSIPGGEVEVTVRAALAELASEEAEIASMRAMLLGFAAEAERIAPDLPSDMAENHDHYAHGAPKR